MKVPEKIHSITFLRFLAAIWVVYHHYGPKVSPENWFWFHLKNEGPVAVSFFFVLSGFVLQHRYGNSLLTTWRSFMVKRIKRIHPNYILAFLATLVYFFFVEGARPVFFSVLLQSVALHAWVPDWSNTLNYPSWSISVEYAFYLSFPFLTRWYSKSTFQFALFVLLVYIASAWFFIYYNLIWYQGPQYAINNFFLFNPIMHFNAFLVGIMAHHVYNRFTLNSVYAFVLVLAALCLLACIIFTNNPIRSHIHNGLLGPVFALIIVGVAWLKGALQRSLSLSPLRFLGDVSYGVYLWQAPLAFFLFRFWPNLSFAGFLFLLISWTALVYVLIEKKPSNVRRK